jgi:hypothetical protein
LNQVTLHVTITDSTPRAVAAIIGNADDHPGHTTPDPGGQAPFLDIAQAPICTWAPGSWETRPFTRSVGRCRPDQRDRGGADAVGPDGAAGEGGRPAGVGEQQQGHRR